MRDDSSLATKYRPKTFDDLTEQVAVKTILENQARNGTFKHGYLFAGGAGTRKSPTFRQFSFY